MSRTPGPALLLALALAAAPAAADEPKLPPPSKERGNAGKALPADGLVVRREAADKPWQPVKDGETLPSNELIIGSPLTALESKDGAVRLNFLTDFSGTSPYPVIEAAVVLHVNAKADLD